MELTLNDIRELLTGSTPTANDPCDPKPGDKVLIRTVTMTLTGEVVACSPSWVVLDKAAWIADTGRFSQALSTGVLSEIEPMGDGVRVARGAVVDVAAWKHDLPTVMK